jgi:hypothetical protein
MQAKRTIRRRAHARTSFILKTFKSSNHVSTIPSTNRRGLTLTNRRGLTLRRKRRMTMMMTMMTMTTMIWTARMKLH